eukprot:8953510-Pyramimonas_sp.AAC.1
MNNTTCTSRQYLDHARSPSDHCALVSDWDGGGADILPAVCRPTRRYDGHPAAMAHRFSTTVAGADTFPDVYCTRAGAPGALYAGPERC